MWPCCPILACALSPASFPPTIQLPALVLRYVPRLLLPPMQPPTPASCLPLQAPKPTATSCAAPPAITCSSTRIAGARSTRVRGRPLLLLRGPLLRPAHARAFIQNPVPAPLHAGRCPRAVHLVALAGCRPRSAASIAPRWTGLPDALSWPLVPLPPGPQRSRAVRMVDAKGHEEEVSGKDFKFGPYTRQVGTSPLFLPFLPSLCLEGTFQAASSSDHRLQRSASCAVRRCAPPPAAQSSSPHRGVAAPTACAAAVGPQAMCAAGLPGDHVVYRGPQQVPNLQS
jgi:hypothetical protein